MSGRGSKAKGSGYERELAAWLNDTVPGVRSRRALLSGGGRDEGGADLDGTPGIHIEAKRTEAINVKAALRQAEAAIAKAAEKAMPVVVTRQNRMATGESLVVMRAGDWAKLYAAWLAQEKRSPQPGDDGFLF